MKRLLVFAALALLHSSCKADCTATSCLGGTYCGLEGACVYDCLTDLDCSQLACDPEDACCTGFPICDPAGRCAAPQRSTTCDAPPPSPPDGWDDPPGTGLAFVVTRWALADPTVGTNVDDRCDDAGCTDNLLGALGELVNDQLRQNILGGEMLTIVEIAGLTENYAGFDRSVTIKVYGAHDADDPFYPANNFKVPPGHTECCQFLLNAASLSADLTTARVRMPARIRAGRIETVTPTFAPLVYQSCPWDDDEPFVDRELLVERAMFTGTLRDDLSGLDDGLFSGAASVGSLDLIENPYCRAFGPRCRDEYVGSSVAVLARDQLGPPDIDVDGDGLECAFDNDGDGTTDRCCDGAGSVACSTAAPRCAGNEIVSSDPAQPGLCVRNIVDGYSFALTVSGVAAEIHGVR